MDVAETQAQGTTDHGEISHQVQNRLLHIDTQMTHIRAQVERLITEASTSSSQFTVLLRHMTDPQPLQSVQERLVALLEHVENQQEQLNLVVRTLPELADKAQLAAISDTMTRLGRTQFKSNALGETREQHLERSLTLQRHLTHGLSYMPLRDVVIAHFSRPPWGPILPVGVPTTHMPAPWTPGRSLGAGKVLDTARIRSPWRSSEVRQPRVLTSRGLCITPVAP